MSARASAGETDPRAVELFRRSAELYREGRFAETAELLRKAYALQPEPILLFNLGRACEGMGDAPCAVDAYTRYLATSDASKDRGTIESRIRTLERQVAERAELERQRNAASALQPLPAEPPPPPRSPVPWIVASVGLAGVGASIALGVAAKNMHDEALGDPVQKTEFEKQSKAESLATATNVVLVGGVVLAVGGVVWAMLDRAQDGKKSGAPSAVARVLASVRVGPGSLGFGGTF